MDHQLSILPQKRSRWQKSDTFRHQAPQPSKKSHSRWSIDKSFTPPPLTYIPSFLSQDQFQLILRQYRIQDISRALTAHDFKIHDPDIRSPSPEPIYDPKTNQRINTRQQRAIQKLNRQRNTCIQECLKIDPHYKPPPDYRPPLAVRKLYIPQSGPTHPQSYVKLILGHGGRTQKTLEKKTNCKIYIRGHGASRGKNYQFENQDQPMHVLIQGPTETDVDNCCMILEPILKGNFDDEDAKERRLELAQMGSDRLAIAFKSDWCQNCGEQGHKKYSCPSRPLAIGWIEKSVKQKKSIEESLEEFNRVTGAGMRLNAYDHALISSQQGQRTEKKVEEPHDEEDLLPPGVDY